MSQRSRQAASVALPLGVAVLVGACFALGVHDGPGVADFPGHAALLASLRERFAAERALPLWTPDWYAGASLVMAYLHPLVSLAALAPFASAFGIDVGLRVGAAVFMVAAALAMYGFCLAFSGSRRGAALGAAVYALHPSVFAFVGASGQVHQPVSMTLVPLVFWGWLRLAERASARRALATAVASALLFTDMQRFWMVAPFAGALYLGVALLRGVSPLRALGAGLAVAVGVAGLVCFPALPGLAESHSLRWHQPQAIEVYRERHSLPGLPALLDRGGALTAGSPWSERFAALPGQWYQGAVALLFVAGGVWAARRDGRVPLRGAAALVLWLAALALAFGVNAAGSPAAAFAAFPVATALAAGFAAVALWGIRSAALARWPAGRVAIDAAGALGIVALALIAPFPQLARVFVYERIRAPAHFAFPLLGFALGAAAATLMPAWSRRLAPRARTAFACGCIALVAVDVAPSVGQLALRTPEALVAEATQAFGALRGRPPGRLLDTRQYDPLANRFGIVEAGRPLAWGWLGWSSSRFTSELVVDGIYASLRQAALDPEARERALETAAGLAAAAHVRFVSRIAPGGPALPRSPDSPSSPFSPPFSPVWDGRRIEIDENALALPYLQLYGDVALATGTPREVLPVVARLAVRGLATLTLPGAPDDTLPAGLVPAYAFGARARELAPDARPVSEALTAEPPGGDSECVASARDGQHLELSCRGRAPGYLVVAESWSPRWAAAVDGRRVPLLRLNHAFRGVALPAGAHRVEIAYRPGSLLAGSLWVSALCWTLAGAFGIRALIRRSPAP